MINNSSDPAGSPTMRTVYLRASPQASAIVPPATDPPSNLPTDDGVINLITRPSATGPSATRLMAMDSPERSDAAMKAFSWEAAQAMLADPMQAMRAQRAPMAESVAALLDSNAG